MRPLGGRELVLGASLLIAGCNIIQFQRASIVGSLRSVGVESTEADVGDAHVHYWNRRGRGTPIVLVHGFGGASLWQWYTVIPAIAGRPIVAPDLLWFGGSSSYEADFSLDHQVRTLLLLLDRLGYERFDIVGISYGGLVAYEIASQHPERVRRLVLVGSPGREFTRADYDALCRRFGVRSMTQVLIPETERDVRMLLGLAYAEPPWVPEFALWQVREVMYSEHRGEQRALMDTLLRDIDVLRARPDPSAPTLLIWGRDDRVFPLSIGRRLQRRLAPRARLAIIDRAAHAPNIERPEPFNRLLTEFLRDP